jgi:hypothetical protein
MDFDNRRDNKSSLSRLAPTKRVNSKRHDTRRSNERIVSIKNPTPADGAETGGVTSAPSMIDYPGMLGWA